MSQEFTGKLKRQEPISATIIQNKKSQKSRLPYHVNAPRKIYTIKAENWDKDLPYYFAVVKAQEGSGKVRLSDKVPEFDNFVLPINPTNLSVSVPFAINVYPTTRGVVEEFNGTVFRNIVIAGTTGVTPKALRLGGGQQSLQKTNKFSSLTGGFVNASLGATNELINSLKSFGAEQEVPLTPAVSDDVWEFGHAKLHQLANYLVAYSEYKKNNLDDNAKHARLVFVSQKDNTAYVVSPVSFTFNKSVANPHVFNYKIVLRAYDLADIDSLETNVDVAYNKYFTPINKDSTVLQNIFDTIQRSRAIISNAYATINAVVADIESVFTVISDAMMVTKSLLNVPLTLADMPSMVKDAWKYMVRDIKRQVKDLKNKGNRDNSQKNKNLLKSSDILLNAAKLEINEASVENPFGLPVTTASIAKQTRDQIKLDIRNPLATFKDFAEHIDFLDEYPLSNFELTPEQQEILDTQINSAKNKTIADYDEMRRKIEEARDVYADYNNINDEDYNKAANRTIVSTLTKSPTTDDYKIILAFNDIIRVIDTLSATNDIIRLNIPDPFVRAQQIVNGSNIVIRSANVAYPVPFPYGGTLEQLASLYLNNPDRWIDIAILNELEPPYIDEDGFERYFSSSGNHNSFTVSDKSNLFLNQEIWISSLTRRPELRHITNITEIGANNYLITVDGEDNLNEFTTSHQAKMKAYLPNTVNSNKIIFIPYGGTISDEDLVPDTREIPITKNLDKQQKLMGVDLAITDNYDLALTNNGDIKLISGYNNAIQALKLKIGVKPGELKRHPTFGAGLGVGERLDATAEDIKKSLEKMILSDARFESLSSIQVEFQGSAVFLNLVVNASNGSGAIPIKFKL